MYRQDHRPRATQALQGMIAGAPLSLALWYIIGIVTLKIFA